MDEDKKAYQDYVEYQKYLASHSSPTEPGTGEKVADAALAAANIAGKVSDYIPGISRTAIQKGIDVLPGSGTDAAGTAEQALTAEAQPFAEYFKKKGMPELGSVDVPVPTEYLRKKLGESMHLTGRGGLGMIADIASDPVVMGSVLAAPFTEGLSMAAGGPRLASIISKAAKGMQAARPLSVLKDASEAGPMMKNWAETASAKAMGATKANINKHGIDKVRAVGRYGLDEGIVTPLASTEDKILRNQKIGLENINKRNAAYNAIDEANASTHTPNEVANKFLTEQGDFMRSPVNRDVANQYQNLWETLAQPGNEKNLLKNPEFLSQTRQLPTGQGMFKANVVPMSKAQELQEILQDAANYNNVSPGKKELLNRKAAAMNREAMIIAAEDAASTLKDPKILQDIVKGNKVWANKSVAEKMLSNKQAAEIGNRGGWSSPTDIGAGIGGAALGHGGLSSALTGAATVTGKKVAEKYGRNFQATLLDLLSKGAMKTEKPLGGLFSVMSKLPPEVAAKLLMNQSTQGEPNE